MPHHRRPLPAALVLGVVAAALGGAVTVGLSSRAEDVPAALPSSDRPQAGAPKALPSAGRSSPEQPSVVRAATTAPGSPVAAGPPTATSTKRLSSAAIPFRAQRRKGGRGHSVSPFTYGAVGDGVHDDTAALQAAFDAAGPGRPVVLPTGEVFAHSAVLHLRVAGETVDGGGTLLAVAEATSSVWVEAADVTVDNVTLRTASTTQRWSAWEQMGLRVMPFDGDVIRDVTVEGSAAAGIYVGGATHFVLDHDTVRDTRADGIHMTGGAADGTVVDPMTMDTGDDGIAVVSYESDPTPCHDITVTGATVLGTTGGRGMSVVGGTRITYSDVDVERSAAAGIYVADEGDPYDTYAPHDVTVSGGRVVGANTDASIDHGAVLVVNEQSDDAPSDVTISDLDISDTRTTASRDAGVITYGTSPTDIVLDGFTITGGPPTAYQGNAPAGSFSTTGWTQDGRPLPDQG